MSERLLYLGGSSLSRNDGLGPSSVALQIGDKTIGVDCGLEILPGGKYGFPDFSLLKSENLKFSALVLTHSHLDHIGGVGQASENGMFAENAVIWGSPQTNAILPFILDETWSRGVGQSYYRGVNIPVGLSKNIPLGEFEILPGVRAFTGAAGHIPGALYVVIETSSGKKILFCGDNGWHEQEIVGGSTLPDGIPDSWLPDVIAMTDLTNPSLTSLDYELEIGRLVRHVGESLAKKKIVIIAAFANGRAQNVALALARAGIKPVYADGSGVENFKIFKNNRWSPKDKEFSFDGVEFIENGNVQRENLLAEGGPLVVVTPAGFGDGGPVRYYLEKGLGDTNFEFIATSWLMPGCTMDRLLHKVEARKKFGRPVRVTLEDEFGVNKTTFEVKCEAYHFHLSAHGGLGETVEMVKKIVARREKNLEVIVLTHGTQESKHRATNVLRPYTDSVIYGQIGTVINL
jgi:Cft2 family RNA processing exonuclease